MPDDGWRESLKSTVHGPRSTSGFNMSEALRFGAEEKIQFVLVCFSLFLVCFRVLGSYAQRRKEGVW